MLPKKTTRAVGATLIGLAAAATQMATAATIVNGDVTSTLGPNFFIDDALIGGTDTTVNQPNAGNFDKDFGGIAPLNVGAGGTTITLTGIGWALNGSAANNDATSASVTITYLGADGIFGGAGLADNVVIGTVTDAFTYSGAGEYYWTFDTPLVAIIDGANDLFRISISPSNGTANGSFAFKNTGGVKISAAGTSVAVIPEPSATLLGGFGLLCLLRRRRA